MVTVSEEAGQLGELIVHTNLFVPTDNPVTPDVGSVGIVTVAPPTMTVHAPVPTDGVLPARVAVDEQTDWSGPAFAAVTASARAIVTVSRDGGQVAFVIVQTNVLIPTVNPVTPEIGSVGIVTEALPTSTVHEPDPIVGVFPVKIDVELHAVWSGPAFATVGD